MEESLYNRATALVRRRGEESGGVDESQGSALAQLVQPTIGSDIFLYKRSQLYRTQYNILKKCFLYLLAPIEQKFSDLSPEIWEKGDLLSSSGRGNYLRITERGSERLSPMNAKASGRETRGFSN